MTLARNTTAKKMKNLHKIEYNGIMLDYSKIVSTLKKSDKLKCCREGAYRPSRFFPMTACKSRPMTDKRQQHATLGNQRPGMMTAALRGFCSQMSSDDFIQCLHNGFFHKSHFLAKVHTCNFASVSTLFATIFLNGYCQESCWLRRCGLTFILEQHS